MKKEKKTVVELKRGTAKKDVTEYISTIECDDLFENRAHDLANIIKYDFDNYHDVNIETVLRAAQIAGLVKIKDLPDGIEKTEENGHETFKIEKITETKESFNIKDLPDEIGQSIEKEEIDKNIQELPDRRIAARKAYDKFKKEKEEGKV